MSTRLTRTVRSEPVGTSWMPVAWLAIVLSSMRIVRPPTTRMPASPPYGQLPDVDAAPKTERRLVHSARDGDGRGGVRHLGHSSRRTGGRLGAAHRSRGPNAGTVPAHAAVHR